MRRVLRLFVGLLAVAGVAWFLTQSSGAQIPPPPTLPPGFTFPTFPPPPTMPPFTTTPPPTMPPPTSSTSTPPPTMPPPTIQPPNVDQEIESLIDKLEQFGDRFNDVIDELRDLQARF